MRHGSLFSGIGGFDLAAQWMGWENVFQVEIDPFCQKVLAKNFPNVKRYGDIKQFDGTQYSGAVDIISGGFPCQPFSTAGKRKGREDDRYLWPEMLRVIDQVKPAFVVGENVAGILSMEGGQTLERILTDLEGIGYQTETIVLPACSVGAWHRRDRTWIIAYTNNSLHQGGMGDRGNTSSTKGGKGTNGIKRQAPHRKRVRVESGTSSKTFTITNSARFQTQRAEQQTTRTEQHRTFHREWWEAEPAVGRVANGIPNRVDRIKGLGNAIVPQVAYEIFKAIEIAQ